MTPHEEALLTFEETRPAPSGLKTEQIRITFGLTAPEYYVALARLAHRQDAIAAHPMLCKRIQRNSHRRATARNQLLNLGTA